MMNDAAKTNNGWQTIKFFRRLGYRIGLRPLNSLLRGCDWILGTNFSKLLRQKCDSIFEGILISITPTVSCTLNGRPEIHSLVSHKHMSCYILAIKSFLRFYNNVTVVVHDDSSLTKKDKRTLKKHIKNINIIDRDFADKKIHEIFDRYPNCRRYRDEYVNALQLFDFMLFCKSDKIVSLDSDILFFKKPDALIDWLRDGKKIIPFWEQEPLGTREFLTKINLDDCFIPMCIAFLCFYKEAMNLDLLEQLLAKIEKFDWWTGQCIYPILLKKQIEKHGLSFFEPPQYQDGHGFSDGQTLRHYWFSRGTSDIYLSDRKKIIKKLLNTSNADEIRSNI